jgi:hypothetical protein
MNIFGFMSFYTTPITKKLNKNDWQAENPGGYRLSPRGGQSKLLFSMGQKRMGNRATRLQGHRMTRHLTRKANNRISAVKIFSF